MTCRENMDLGAYVLGALSPGERSALERHLADCADCKEELVLLAPLPGLLRHTSLEEMHDADRSGVGGSAPPPPRTRPGSVRRRAVLVGTALVAAVVCVLVVVLLPGNAAHSGNPPHAVTLSNTDPETHVRASVALEAETWGTSMDVTLSHLPPGRICRLVVHSHQGVTETGGTWSTDYGGSSGNIPAATSISPQDIDTMEVVTDTNQVLVRIP
ncbi:anti-sigma factor [Streptomyces krungchingensis]|uniref:anti-sigma factor family protein n=1 Tax=Streptomyces krungchingensis TaxID=1565034 RepID=UPI003CEAFECE